MEPNLGLYLLSVAAISVTGVMLPGPMTAATVAKGYNNRHAGAWIAAGHGIVEIPLIAAIYFGLGHVIASPQVSQVMYLAGGLVLVYLGLRMFGSSGRSPGTVGGLPNSPLVTGIVITATNPAFYIWWATVGVALVAGAARFGPVAIALLALVHLPCDLIWSEFLSVGTFKSRRWWTAKVQKIVFGVCALVLIGFGAWFAVSAFL